MFKDFIEIPLRRLKRKRGKVTTFVSDVNQVYQAEVGPASDTQHPHTLILTAVENVINAQN